MGAVGIYGKLCTVVHIIMTSSLLVVCGLLSLA